MRRVQETLVHRDLEKKMVLIAGPRQVGKTWLAQQIGRSFSRTVYLNNDQLEDRRIIAAQGWLPDTELLILDELHKQPGWKRHLKGIYDTRPEGMRILVTGSARLDTFRQGGDSLAGRYFAHRLLPLSPSELKGTPHEGDLERLMARGGFPEPFLAKDAVDADRWRLQYTDGLIREDVLDLERIHDLRAMRLLLERLRGAVGSPVSFASIARDLGTSPNTAKKYIQILEALFVIFRVAPHARGIARSLRKEPKFYFFDTGQLPDDPGARFENLVALSLLKHALGRTDSLGRVTELRYLRTKEGHEVDFCLVAQERPTLMLEAKVSRSRIPPSLRYFRERHDIPAVLLVHHLRREQVEAGVEIRRARPFLEGLATVHQP